MGYGNELLRESNVRLDVAIDRMGGGEGGEGARLEVDVVTPPNDEEMGGGNGIVDTLKDIAQSVVEDNISIRITIKSTNVVILKILCHGRKERKATGIESILKKRGK